MERSAAPAIRPAFPSLLSLCRRHTDLLILLGFTLLAALPRLWALGDLPRGVHGDEAQFAMDAQHVLDSGWIGVYTPSALGQPAGIAYVAAPGQWLFGATALGARFGVAVFAVAAVPLAYLLFRLLAGRTVAVIAAFLLAVSLWHVHLSRVAAPTALVPTIELATLLLWALALRHDRWFWFALAGACLGLGLYSYNVYPIFVVAFALWVAAYTIIAKRGAAFLPWARNVALAAATAVVVALPLFAYIADADNQYFSHYREYYDRYSVLESPAFEEAGFGGRAEIIADQVEGFFGTYAWRGVTDFVDGASPNSEPLLGPLVVGLLVSGVLVALLRWREPANLLCLIMLAVIPLTSILQTNATYRGPLGAVPFLLCLAALPLALVWQQALTLGGNLGRLAGAGVIIVLLLVAYRDLHVYFGVWARSPHFDLVYARQISEASLYAQSLPGRPYVYFYSARWRFNYETRLYLAPDLEGEDRSREFGPPGGNIRYPIDEGHNVLFLLLPSYLGDLAQLESDYPNGDTYVARDGDDILFIAYYLRATQTPR